MRIFTPLAIFKKTASILFTALFCLLIQNAKAQLSLTTQAVPATTIDFSTTIAGVGKGTWAGNKIEPGQVDGELNSNGWSVSGTGTAASAVTFGLTATGGGASTGNNGAGTFYAYNYGSGNPAAGVSLTGTFGTPGYVALKITNNTGITLTSINLSYLALARNSGNRSNSISLYSSPTNNNNSYTLSSGFTFTSSTNADNNWSSATESGYITGLSIANGSSFYLKWETDDVAGSGNRDELAIDNISVTGYGSYLSQFVSSDFTEGGTKSATQWCAGETRNVKVTVKNIGTATWSNSSPDINIGVKWNSSGTCPGGNWCDYYIRTDANGLAPGATQTYTLSLTASNNTGSGYTTPLAAGTNNITFDVVEEGVSWFGDNGGNTGPGNSKYTSAAITINALPQGSLTGNSVCAGGQGQLTWTASAGTGPFTVVYNDGTANQTATNVSSGTPFNVVTNPTTPGAYTYTLVSVTNSSSAGSCVTSSGFTGGTATINVKALPDVSNFSTSASSVCASNANVVTINSTTLGNGTAFTVTYNLSGSNTATGSTASLTLNSNSGTFTIPAASLPNPGSTIITITSIKNSSTTCSSSPSSPGNTATFTVQSNSAAPVVSSPICVGATSVSGTSTEADGTIITIYKGGVSQGTTSVSGGNWTITGLAALASSNVITATATAPGKCVSATSASVTVATSVAPVVSSPICIGATSVSGTSGEGNGTVITVYKGGVSQGTTTVSGGNWTISGLTALASGDIITATATASGKCASATSASVTVATSAAPVISSPICVGATSVSGTSTEADGTIITVYKGGVSQGTTTVSGGNWTKSGLTALASGNVITATATASGKCLSSISASVTVATSAAPVVSSPICVGATSVSGTSGEANGTIITVYKGGVSQGTTTVSGGNWTITGLTALVSGDVITATATASGKCVSSTSSSVTVATSATPVISSPICAGSTAVSGTSTEPDGTVITVYKGGVSVGTTTVSSGNWTKSGLVALSAGDVITATAVASNKCISSTSASFTVQSNSASPVVSSPICIGATSVSGTSTEADGTVITVYKGGVSQGTTTVSGGNWTITGLAVLASGNVITATATAPGKCVSVISSSVTVATSGAPVVSSPICAGSTSVTGTSSEANGTVITIYKGGVSQGTTTVSGGNWTISGLTVLTGGDIITATANASGKCVSATSASVTVQSNSAAPVVSSPICAGSTSVSGTSTEANGTVITVYKGGVSQGTTTVSGGNWTITGLSALVSGNVITATATASGKCVSAPSGSVTVSALPIVYNVTGGGSYCSGGSGVAIGLSGSETGVNYQLKNGPSNVGSPIAGTNAAISFGNQTAAGTYTVVATNATTLCTSTMSGSVTVTINPLPIITSVTATPSTICYGSSSNLVVAAPTQSAATIVNYDFNNGSSFSTLTPTLASGITSSATGSASFNNSNTGNVTTATTPAAFTTNSTAGADLTSAQNTTWTFTLAGSSLQYYKTFKVYAQAVRGSGGSNTITLSYALNGSSTYITTGITSGTWTLGTNGTWVSNIASLPTATDNPATSISFRLTIGSGGTPVQLDNFQVLAVSSDAYSWTASPSGATAGLPANAGTSLGTNNSINVTPTVATTYTVTATTINGCQQTGSPVTVAVNPLPTATISGTTTVCRGSSPAPVITFTGANGTAPYTFIYTINGGSNQTVTTSSGNSVTVSVSTATAGSFTYSLVSVKDASSTTCSQNQTGSATVTINALPTATISGTTAVCQGSSPAPVITFTGANGTAPYTFTYTINGGSNQTITTSSGNSVTIPVSTATAGLFTYALVSVKDASSTTCSQNQSGSATVTVNPLPTATISGTTAVCKGSSPAPVITFTGANGTAPYTFTYTINGGSNQTIATSSGNSVTISVSTATAGSFTYALVSVKDASTTTCSQNQSGSATVTVNQLPAATISGTAIVCQNNAAPLITFTGANGTAPYTFSYNINGGSTLTVTTLSGNSVTISQSTTTPGTYIYNLLGVQDASSTACSQVQSGSATITVNAPVAITTQPQSQNTCATYPVSFTVTATGDSLYYQWYKNGVALTDNSNISGSQTSELDIDQAGTTDAGTYYVIVSGSYACSIVQSDNAVLAVNQEIVINTQPVSDTVCAGSTAVFTINATGTGISYQWRKGTVPLTDGTLGDGAVIAGSQTATLTITGVTAAEASTPGNKYNVVLTSPGGACPGANSAKVNLIVNPIPTVNAVSNKTVCNTATASVNFTGTVTGTVYNWTNDNTAIGLAASGTGNLSFIATNSGTAPVTGNITVTPTYTNGTVTCTGNSVTFSIAVNPTATINTITNQAYCNGDPTNAINFSSSATGGSIVYNWTNDKPSIGLAASGTGNIASFTATNSTNAPVTATIVVTPSYTNGSTTCAGTSQTFTITVNPTATVNSIANQNVCNNSATTAVNFGSNATGGSIVYNWTNNTPSIGLAASGSGNIASFIATNSTTAPITATITVTASYTNAGTTCTGPVQTFTITVNPTATVNSISNQDVCSGSSTAAINFNSPTTGGTIVYNWTNNTPSIGLAASGSGNIASFIATNTGNATVIATITVTPSYTNGSTTCTGTPVQFTITVRPLVTVTPLSQNECSGSPITTITNGALPLGTISWTRNAPAGISSLTIGTSGTGPIIGTFTNANSTATVVTFTINTTAANGCTSTVTATVNVYPALVAPVIAASQILCGSSNPSALTISTAPSGGSGSYSYQWQQSTVSSTGPWLNVTGATGTSYTPPRPAATTYYQLVITDACGSVTSNAVQISTANDYGLSFSGSNIDPTYCAEDGFEDDEISGSILGSLVGSKYIRYTWQSVNPGDFTANVTNPYGYDVPIFFGLFTFYEGDAFFTVHNSTSAPVTGNLQIIPKVYNNNGTVYCNLTPDVVTVVINPKATINTVSNQVVCKGSPTAAVTFSSPTTGGTISYSWINNNTAIGLAASGTGNIASFTAANSGSTAITATITVTPNYTNGGKTCSGTATSFTITVNPTTTVNTVSNQTVCNNSSTAAINFSGTGTSYTWTNNTTSIGLAASGTGNISSFTATNAGSAPVTATITVTPQYTNGSVTCPGTAKTFTITVNPTPTASISAAATSVCTGTGTTITFTGTANAVVSYTVNGTPATITLNGSGTASLNTGNLTIPTTYALTSIAFASTPTCNQSLSGSVIVNINPNVNAGVVSGTPTTICIGATTTYSSNGDAGGIWSSSNTAIATVNSTTGVVTGVSAGSANIIYTINTGCGAPKSAQFAVSINANATAGTITGTSPICIGITTTYAVSGNSAAGIWSSTNTSVATVDASGNVLAAAAGTTNIVYTVNSGCNAPVSTIKALTVSPNANAGTITGATLVCVGAQVVYSSSGDAGGTWSSSNTAIATVTSGGVVKGISAGTATIIYKVNGCNGPVQTSQDITVSNAGGVSDPGVIAGTTSACYSAAGVTYSVDPLANPNATTFIWTVPSGWTITAGQGTSNIMVTTGTSAGTISVVAGNTCGFSNASTLSIGIHNLWVGGTSSDWNNAANWSDNQLPSMSCMTVIPSGTTFPPKLKANTSVSDISIASGAYLDLNDFNLNVSGAFSGTGTLSGTINSGLIISTAGNANTVYFKHGRPYNELKTLTLNTGSTLTLGKATVLDTLNIVGGNPTNGYGVVTANGILNTNGILNLLSDISGTAQVGQSYGKINDTVTVQRYFPPIRAWRFVAVPFSSSNQTINGAWQEGNVYCDYSSCNSATWNGTPGYGTEISYNNICGAGYDYHNNVYKPSLQSYYNDAWVTPGSTYTPLTSYNAYSLFVRGDRTVCLSGTYPAVATILRPRGILNQVTNGADIVQNIPAGAANGYVMVSNPYAASIKLDHVIADTSSSGIVANQFIIWDPRLGGSAGVGGYVTYGGGVQVPTTADPTYTAGTLIQSGQAFMVQRNSAGSGHITFHETDKVPAYTQDVNVFGLHAVNNGTAQTPSVIYTNLLDMSNAVMDGVAGAYGNYSAAVDEVDAPKKWNEEIENMALIRHDTALAIEFRPIPKNSDTLFYQLYLRQHPYKLQVFSQNLTADFSGKAWIVDKYLKKQTEINLRDTSYYNFTPNSDTNSYRNRFMLVLSPANGGKAARIDSLITKIKSHIYPNPVSGRTFTLVLENAVKDDYTVNIYTASGRLAATRKISGEDGINNWNIPVPLTLTSGSYMVQILNSDKRVVCVVPLIISR